MTEQVERRWTVFYGEHELHLTDAEYVELKEVAANCDNWMLNLESRKRLTELADGYLDRERAERNSRTGA